jgi:hypothetical protein
VLSSLVKVMVPTQALFVAAGMNLHIHPLGGVNSSCSQFLPALENKHAHHDATSTDHHFVQTNVISFNLLEQMENSESFKTIRLCCIYIYIHLLSVCNFVLLHKMKLEAVCITTNFPVCLLRHTPGLDKTVDIY